MLEGQGLRPEGERRTTDAPLTSPRVPHRAQGLSPTNLQACPPQGASPVPLEWRHEMSQAITDDRAATATHTDTLSRPARAKWKPVLNQTLLIVTLAVLLALSFITIILMVFLSLKDNGQIYGRFWNPPDPIIWDNYRTGWESMRRYVLNSLLYSFASVIGVVFLSSLSGYVFAR